MNRQGFSLATVIGALALAAILPAAASGATHDVNANPATWEPNELGIALGDEVRWNFPSPGVQHDVWLIAPGEAPDSAGTEVTNGPVDPGGPSVTHTFDQTGTWIFVCKIHSFVSGGAWTGMTGTVNVTATPTLRLTVKPKKAKAKAGKATAITGRVANTGAGTAQGTKVCVKAKKKLVKLKGNKCRTFGAVAPGAASQAKFKFKPKPAAKGKKVKITFTATAANAPKRTATATLKVAR